MTELAKRFAVTAAEVTGGSRRRRVAAARAAIGAVAVLALGLPVTRVARAGGVTAMPLLRGLSRGRARLATHGLEVERQAIEQS